MPDKTEWIKMYERMPDGGPVYTETNLVDTIAEPWNAISSLAFLIPAIYWAWQSRHNIKGNIFLWMSCLLLALGGLGSTLFHAFRKFPLLLWMDVLPIILLTLAVSIYFWLKILPKAWYVLLIIIPSVVLRFWAMNTLPGHDAINVGYFISGTMIFLPIMLLLINTKFVHWKAILFALLALSLALFFRKIDANTPPLMSIGTHWLWHVLCAVGAYYLGDYIYQSENSFSKKDQRLET